jgi:hypothetical protein
VLLLVEDEFIDFRHHLRGAPTGEPPLRLVNANRSVFSGVVNLQDSVAQRFAMR